MISNVLMLYPSTGLASDQNPYLTNLDAMAQTARELGMEVSAIVAQDAYIPAGTVDHLYRVRDLKNLNDLNAIVSHAQRRGKVDRIFPLHESLVLPAGILRRVHGIPGMSLETAWNFRSKNEMHEKAKQAQVPVPRAHIPKTFEDLRQFAMQVGFPVVVKPFDGSGCHETFVVQAFADLHEAWKRIAEAVIHFRVEEFISSHEPGGQYHVDGLVRGGKILFSMLSRYTVPPLQFREEIPQGTRTRRSNLTEGEQNILKENEKLLGALGMKSGVFHAEFFLTENQKVFLGEVGARLGGGMIVPMIEQATGVSLARDWVRLELDPNYHPVPKEYGEFGGEFLVASAQGYIEDMTSQEELLRIPDVVSAGLWMQKEGLFAPSRSTQMIGYVVFRVKSEEQVMATTQKVRKGFKVRMREQFSFSEATEAII